MAYSAAEVPPLKISLSKATLDLYCPTKFENQNTQKDLLNILNWESFRAFPLDRGMFVDTAHIQP